MQMTFKPSQTQLKHSQICTSIVESHTQENGLKLNQQKCEVLLIPSSENSEPSQITYPIVSSVRILGSWFTSDLSSKTSVANNKKKAYNAFFANGKSGLLEGKPNPLTSREIVKHCVIPIPLYGSEHWTLNESLISSLESCQAKLGKRILALSRFTSNFVPCLTLYWPSIRTRILLRKLFFLRRCIMNENTISGQVLRSILAKTTAPSLVQQCHFLEQLLGTNRTDKILSAPQYVTN